MRKNVYVSKENGSITIELAKSYRIHYERIYNKPESLTIYNERTGSRLSLTLNPFKVTELKYNNAADRHAFATIIANLASLKTL